MPLLITQSDLRPLLDDPASIEGAFAAVEGSFREYQRGEAVHTRGVDLPLQGEQRSLRVLPAASPSNGASVRLYPLVGRSDNPDSYVNVLFDGNNGQLRALISGDDLNVLRTAVPGGVGCRHLAPPNTRVMGMLGSGRQARGQLIAARHALPDLERVRIFSPTAANRERLAAELGQRFGIAVEAVNTAQAAVEGADVVGITSNSRQPVLEAGWVRQGTLVVSIGAGQLPADLVAGTRVIVSARSELTGPGVRREPYTSMIAAGQWGDERIAAEIGEIIQGTAPARVAASDTVLYEMPGVSLWDAAILNWAYQWCLANEVGTEFHLTDR